MRLLIVGNSFSAHTQRWARAMASRGHEVTVLSQESDDPIPGVRVVPFKVPRWSLRFPQRWFGRYRAFMRSVVKQSEADLVHVHFLSPYYFGKKDLCGRPLVISVWGSDVIRDGRPEESDEARTRKVRLLREADKVTATTGFLAEHCSQYAGKPLNEIEVIPFGIDTAAFGGARRETEATGKDTLRIGFVKHLKRRYGPDILLRSFPDVLRRFPNVELVMVGGGEMQSELEQLSDRLGVAEHVRWKGYVPNGEVPTLCGGFDVFVMPTVISESFGVAAIEAQAAGVPVVASDFPGIREAVQDGVGGILVPPEDPSAIAEAVCRLLGDADLRRRMGKAGQDYVKERFEFSDNVDAMERVYRNVLD